MSSTAVKDEYSLQEAWDRVCGSFAKTTDGLDLTKPPKYTPDQVLEQIRAKQDEDDEKNGKYKVAKEVISKTLDCINILGGIAAQGASMVFGPSDLCFNAVSYLIQTGANYKRIFSSLAELFRRISDVLERCKIYLRMPPEAVDIALRRIINDELLCFVSICALSTKVLKSHKVFIALKVFTFNSDEGVSAELSKLSILVEREDQMRSTLGFESQKTAERGITEAKEGNKKINATVDKVLEFEKKRDANNAEKKQLDDIDANLDNPSESFKIVQNTYKGLLNKKVNGTGEWLKVDPLYTAWTSGELPPMSILFVSGGEGYGKSFLFSTVIRDLQDRYPQGTLTSTSLAYFFFQQESTAKGSQTADKDGSILIKALKVIAWQIAKNDLVYRKDLASSNKCTGINHLQALWDFLFAKSYKTDATFFLLLDGVDEMDREDLDELWMLLVDLQKLSNGWGKFCLRILITARDDTINRVKDHLEGEAFIINMASKNGDDIEKFIKNRINRMPILSGASPQVETLKNEILEKLIKEAHGDFINVGLLLNEISDKQRPGEIRDVLSKSGETRSDTIARKIERLNETLSDNDISDLNELLTWVMFAFRPLTLEELEAVLFMKNREPSLRSLSDQIKDRYSALFRVLGEPDPDTKLMPLTATVSMVSDSIEDTLKAKAEYEDVKDTQAWNASGDVNESEVRIVRRFLESVCDPKLFKKFEFDAFFERKLSKKTARVGIDLETAHLKILTACIQAICSKDTPELDPLLQYAMWNFPSHLSNIDPSLTQPHSKSILGPHLVKLFTEEEAIERWWTDDDMEIRYMWFYKDENVDIVLKWLQDSAVAKKLLEKEKMWVRSLSSKSEPEADLLEHIAKFLARKWLQISDWDIAPLFSSIHSYLTKISNRKNPRVKRATDDPGEEIQVSEIHAAAEWARKQIGLDSLGYEEARNIAKTFRDCGKPEEAIENFKLASSLQSDNWLSQWGLAAVYENQRKWTLAIDTLEGVKKAIESGEAKEDDPKSMLPELLRELGSLNEEAGNHEKALEIYETLLRDYPHDYQSMVGLVTLLRRRGDFVRLLEFLEDLKKTKDERTGLDRRTQAFHELFYDIRYHAAIAAAGANLKTFDVVKDGYQTAIDAAEAKLKSGNGGLGQKERAYITGVISLLLFYFALFCYETHINEDEKQLAVSLWERILQTEEAEKNPDSSLSLAKYFANKKLANVYLEQALLAGPNLEAAAPYVDNLTQLSVIKENEHIGNWSTHQYPKQLLTRYYALTGQKDKAKDTLRAQVKKDLDLLCDEDPSNDYLGYLGLATDLMYAVQDDDVLAAWSLITPDEPETGDQQVETQADVGSIARGAEDKVLSAESNAQNGLPVAKELPPQEQNVSDAKSTTSPGSTIDTAKKLKGPISNYCDGQCGTIWTYANDIYVCKICEDVQFDEHCLKKVRAGTLERRICSKNHEMLHVPKYDEQELKTIGEGNVKVGQKIMTVEDWIQGIRNDWGIPG